MISMRAKLSLAVKLSLQLLQRITLLLSLPPPTHETLQGILSNPGRAQAEGAAIKVI